MKNKFIQVNNNIDKAIAFANSLDQNNILNVQNIKQKPFYIPTMDVIKQFQDKGWLLNGVCEQRGSNRKISSNFIQMHHPDFMLKNKYGRDEAVSSLTISNSCDGNSPLIMNLGLYRQVCSNGLIRFDQQGEQSTIKHTEINYMNLGNLTSLIESKTDKVLKQFGLLKQRELTVEEAREFAYKAAKLKYEENKITDRLVTDLLSINRDEDAGNDLWSTFNRVQETLTENIFSMKQDIAINKQLSSLAYQYAVTA